MKSCGSYLSPSWRSSPSPRWSGSGTRREPSWEPALPAAGCGRWFGPDTIRVAHWAAPAAPPSDLQKVLRTASMQQRLHPLSSYLKPHLYWRTSLCRSPPWSPAGRPSARNRQRAVKRGDGWASERISQNVWTQNIQCLFFSSGHASPIRTDRATFSLHNKRLHTLRGRENTETLLFLLMFQGKDAFSGTHRNRGKRRRTSRFKNKASHVLTAKRVEHFQYFL